MSSNDSIQKDAGYWVVRQHSGDMTAAERTEFESWLRSNEGHRRAYDHASATWRQMDEFQTASFPARDEARRYRAVAPARRPFVRFAFALGLLLAVGTTAFVRVFHHEPFESRQTMKGEHRSFALADGSQMELNTDTRVRVAYSGKARTLYLDQGEALFTVVRDDQRPFEVVAGAGRIVDLSTRFVVYRQPDRVSVTVVEGAVALTAGQNNPIRLSTGEQASYSPTGKLGAIARIDPEAALAWRDDRIVFADTRLGDVMAELARYHSVSYSFGDTRLSDLKVSGSFTTGDLSPFLRTLEATLPVRIQVDGDKIRIDRAGASTRDPPQS